MADTSNLPPGLRLSQMIISLWVPQAIHAAAELGIADLLTEGPLPASVVAERLGTHPDATSRLLYAMVVLGLLSQREAGYELTELGSCLTSDSPTSRRAWSRLMGGQGVWSAWGKLVECVRTGRKAASVEPSSGASDSEHFDAMDDDPRGAEIFHQAMLEMTRNVAPPIVTAIDWAGVRRVVDVGGGYGGLLCAALEQHPELVGSVFDLEHARSGAQALFEARGLAGRASFVAGNFFSQPPPEADVLLLKSVIHDWDDALSLEILGRCRAAMHDHSRLLVIEGPVPEQRTGTAAEWILAFSDLNMLINTGGRERTSAELRSLLERAGLRVDAVRETGGYYCVFEAVRARRLSIPTAPGTSTPRPDTGSPPRP